MGRDAGSSSAAIPLPIGSFIQSVSKQSLGLCYNHSTRFEPLSGQTFLTFYTSLVPKKTTFISCCIKPPSDLVA